MPSEHLIADKTMDHDELVLTGAEEPTVDDFMEWVLEQGFRTGMVGFTMGSFSAEEIFKQDPAFPYLPAGVEDNLNAPYEAEAVVEEMHTEIVRMKKRMDIMAANKSLLGKTVEEVQRRLVHGGKSKEEVERYMARKPPLAYLVCMLYQLEHPASKFRDGVIAWLFLGRKLERKISVYLPIAASLAEAGEMLEEIGRSEGEYWRDYLSDEPVGKKPREWKYQILPQDVSGPVNHRSVKLSNDADYQEMISEINKQNPPLLVITEVRVGCETLH